IGLQRVHGISFFEGKVCDKVIDHLLQLFCLKQISTSLPLIALQVNECLLKNAESLTLIPNFRTSSTSPPLALPKGRSYGVCPHTRGFNCLFADSQIREFSDALICMSGLWAKDVSPNCLTWYIVI